MENNNNVVKDVGRWKWSEMWQTEDWWAIWIAFIILIAGIIIYLPQKNIMKDKINKANTKWADKVRTEPFKNIAWYKNYDAKRSVQAKKISTGKWLKKFTSKPHKWATNPIEAFYLSKEEAQKRTEKAKLKYEKAKVMADESFNKAKEAQNKAKEANFKNKELNTKAELAINSWRNEAHSKKFKSLKKKAKGIKPYNRIEYLVGLGIFFALLFGVAIKIMGNSLRKFIIAFAGVFMIAILAWLISNQATMKFYGIGYAAWSIIIGMLISNTIGTPNWIKPAVQTEFYIKTGLVLLGAKILFEKILIIGQAGIFVAWVVTPTVWLLTYWFGQKVLRIASKRLNATICSDMSVCGVSAAIATAAACKAKKEELTLAVGLSLIFTAIMMVVMPAIIKAFFPVDMQMVLGGAWMGGTIDATGAVAAAGAFLGEKALHVAATIKMIQNVLIGVIALFVAVYFTTKVEVAETGQKVGVLEIWYRFPKFVIGFIIASIVFSLFYSSAESEAVGLGYSMIDQGTVKGMSDLYRSWFFSLSFVSIGLATNFRELKEHFKGGKPLILYITGQSFNLALTLLIAYLMFYVITDVASRI